MNFKISWRTYVTCFVITLIMAFFLMGLINMIIEDFIYYYGSIAITQRPLVDVYLYAFLLLIPISIIHELIHGIAFMAFGGRVKFGYRIIYAYTQETTGLALSKTRFLIVLLSPLFIISIFSVALGGILGTSIYILNLLGCSGDIYMAMRLLKYKKDSKIIDTRFGFDVINT
jgi:hypothetical protein